MSEARDAFEQRLLLVPGDIAARRDAMGAWELAGNEVRVRQLFADGVSGGASAAALAGTTTPARQHPGPGGITPSQAHFH